jgi:glutamate synthase (NADPH/NADH) large chain
MVELEPVPEEEEVAEQVYGLANDLETDGRVDVMADLGTMDAERLQKLIGDHARYCVYRKLDSAILVVKAAENWV